MSIGKGGEISGEIGRQKSSFKKQMVLLLEFEIG